MIKHKYCVNSQIRTNDESNFDSQDWPGHGFTDASQNQKGAQVTWKM